MNTSQICTLICGRIGVRIKDFKKFYRITDGNEITATMVLR